MSQIKNVIVGILVIGFVIHIAARFSWEGRPRADVCKQSSQDIKKCRKLN